MLSLALIAAASCGDGLTGDLAGGASGRGGTGGAGGMAGTSSGGGAGTAPDGGGGTPSGGRGGTAGGGSGGTAGGGSGGTAGGGSGGTAGVGSGGTAGMGSGGTAGGGSGGHGDDDGGSTTDSSLEASTSDAPIVGDGGADAPAEGGTNAPTDGGGGETRDDAASGRPCSVLDHFGAPVPVMGLNDASASVATARFSPDELTAYLAILHGGQPDIYVARRPDRSSPFGAATPFANLNGPGWEANATVTADGLTLFMESSRMGYFDLFESIRLSTAVDFPAPVELTALHTTGEGAPYVTPSGGALYFHRYDNDFNLYRVAITPTGFGPAEPLSVNTTADEHNPIVSPDELTIYYRHDDGGSGPYIWMATRASLNDPFGTPTSLPELNVPYPPPQPSWISPDACRIYVEEADSTGGYWVFMAERPH